MNCPKCHKPLATSLTDCPHCGASKLTSDSPLDAAACCALTESQLEVAARKYCEMVGQDPDRLIGHGADPSPDGRMTMQMCYSPLWKRAAIQIAQHDAMRVAISFSLHNAQALAQPGRNQTPTP